MSTAPCPASRVTVSVQKRDDSNKLKNKTEITELREFKRGRLTKERAQRQDWQLVLPKEHWAFAPWKASETTRSAATERGRSASGSVEGCGHRVT